VALAPARMLTTIPTHVLHGEGKRSWAHLSFILFALALFLSCVVSPLVRLSSRAEHCCCSVLPPPATLMQPPTTALPSLSHA
jgi:hypothetical protein